MEGFKPRLRTYLRIKFAIITFLNKIDELNTNETNEKKHSDN